MLSKVYKYIKLMRVYIIMTSSMSAKFSYRVGHVNARGEQAIVNLKKLWITYIG